MMNSQKKLGIIIDELGEKFPERSSLIAGTMTALVAGEHVLMLGPPGTAKSLFARRVSEATAGGSYFELLLTKFTTVEEMYGPISFTKLKQDKYERMLDGFAATKRIWFLDEIFKSSSALLNCQLTAMNERMFHNGGKPVQIPLEMMLAASNEYPQDESLKAMYDRFCMKFWVDYISDRDQLGKLLLAGGVSTMQNQLTDADLEELRLLASKTVTFTKTQVKTLLDIKVSIEAEGFIVSDRMWVKAVKMIKARAVVNGRDSVRSSDFLVLADMFWKEHKDRDRLYTVIGEAADPFGSRALAIVDAVKTAMRELPDISVLKSGQKTKTEFLTMVTSTNAKLASRNDALRDLVEECGDDLPPEVQEAQETIEAAIETAGKLAKDGMMYREKKA